MKEIEKISFVGLNKKKGLTEGLLIKAQFILCHKINKIGFFCCSYSSNKENNKQNAVIMVPEEFPIS